MLPLIAPPEEEEEAGEAVVMEGVEPDGAEDVATALSILRGEE